MSSERNHQPITDVAAAGGWRGTETLLECYQQADPATMLEMMSELKKLRDRQALG